MENKAGTLPTCGKRYLKLEQAAEKLSITEWTLRRLIYRREIPFFKIGVRQYRFDPDELDNWVAGRRVKTMAEG